MANKTYYSRRIAHVYRQSLIMDFPSPPPPSQPLRSSITCPLCPAPLPPPLPPYTAAQPSSSPPLLPSSPPPPPPPPPPLLSSSPPPLLSSSPPLLPSSPLPLCYGTTAAAAQRAPPLPLQQHRTAKGQRTSNYQFRFEKEKNRNWLSTTVPRLALPHFSRQHEPQQGC